MNLEKQHDLTVKKIQEEFRQSAGIVSFKQFNSNTLRNGAYKENTHTLDLGTLNRIIKIDYKNQYVLVEPKITIRALCDETLKYGLIPPIVPEFATITVGGAVMGTAIESGSHRYGLFFDSCLECELILGNGECVRVSPRETPELFFGISGSYGSLALLTLVKIRLIQARPFVLLSFKKTHSPTELSQSFRMQYGCDFLEGILFSEYQGVIVQGNMITTLKKDIPLLKQSHSWDKWYVYQVKERESDQACMSILDYLFRFDRGAFWIGRYIYSFPLMLRLLFRLKREETGRLINKVADREPSFLFRLLFGWNFSSQKLYKIWHSVPNRVAEQLFFIQDFSIPYPKFEDALTDLIAETGIFPVWLCPVKGTFTPQFLSPHFGRHRFINIGLYGIPKSPMAIPELTKRLEEKAAAYEGKKMLYSFTYYSKERLYEIYDGERYQALRQKYHAVSKFAPIDKKFRS